jgi:broad specificity phosphatase PhoE
MSRLLMIRHAQATLSAEPNRAFGDYDRLSDLGLRQAEHLGEELAASGTVFDRVRVGPARRHRQTADAVASVYERLGLPWPEVETVEELAEHQGASVVERALERPDHDEELLRLREATIVAESADARLRLYFQAFRRVTLQWAQGSLPPSLDGQEDWRSFRARVEVGVGRMLAGPEVARTTAVFTSGGPIGSTVAWALGLGDQAALELAWTLQNATVTELVQREGRVWLKSFNAHPRIGSAELHTHV